MRRSSWPVWVTVVAGGAAFTLYIALAYGAPAASGAWARWNATLGNLYDPAAQLSTLAIGLHMATGAVLMLVGPLQLIPALRARRPAVHRALGQLYVAVAAATGLAGLIFIAARGTVGGPVMSVAFALYGALLVATSWQTWRLGRQRALVAHRAWAMRTFTLGSGSLLYRLGYVLWGFVHGGPAVGHHADWRGPFDLVMDFAFYVPPLLVCELYIRARDGRLKYFTDGLSLALAGVMAVGVALMLR